MMIEDGVAGTDNFVLLSLAALTALCPQPEKAFTLMVSPAIDASLDV